VAASLEMRVAALEGKVRSLERQAHELHDWLDTVCSWPWKRVWWVVQGFRFYRLGRWWG
jgi:hypothetical protein